MENLIKILTATGPFLAAVAALITALVALKGSYNNQSGIDGVRQAAAANGLAIEELKTPSGATSPAAGPPYVVQLATYFASNCQTAADEIRGYGDQLQAAALWQDPSRKYVIVGVGAPDAAAANLIRAKAVAMAKEPAQAGNDLANAKVRTNPGWTPLASCAAVHATPPAN